jgi:hypothetical protein
VLRGGQLSLAEREPIGRLLDEHGLAVLVRS